MYVIVVGAGKVGWNLARELLAKDHEVTLIEADRRRYLIVEQELEVVAGAPAAGKRVGDVPLPEGSLIISVLRGGAGFVPKSDTVIEAGDEVLLILDPGLESAITPQFTRNGASAG